MVLESMPSNAALAAENAALMKMIQDKEKEIQDKDNELLEKDKYILFAGTNSYFQNSNFVSMLRFSIAPAFYVVWKSLADTTAWISSQIVFKYSDDDRKSL
jgi:hypothetical protein